MCPPLTNDTWVYGGDDDTLFRLVTLGSDALQKEGYTRTGHENVVGPMPPMGTIVKNADDLWKIIAFIRAHYDGDPRLQVRHPEVGTITDGWSRRCCTWGAPRALCCSAYCEFT